MPLPSLCFNLLGSFEIHHGNTEVRLAAKPRILLAALLLQAGRRVSTNYLANAVWGTTPPLKPRASLYSYVMRVRKSLASASFDPNHLYAAGDGYLLDARSVELDVVWFERYRVQATDAKIAGDEEAEMAALRSALGLWRGNALEDVPSDVLREGPARRLDEVRLTLLQRRIALDLEAGRHDEILPILTELTSAYPLREMFWKQLISAQYRSEQRAEALESYRRASALLRGELGIDPSTELEALHNDILNDRRPARSLAVATTATSSILRAGSSGQCQLPRDVPDFVGRERTLTSIVDTLMGDTLRPDKVTPRVITLHGPPGIGKTTLAVHAGHRLRDRYPDGQWYVQLSNAKGGATAASVLADALRSTRVVDGELPLGAEALSAMWRDAVADRQVLLVLDDVANMADLDLLLPGTSSCAVIATSRRRLATSPGILQLWIEPMADSEAADLLAGIIGRRRFRDQLDASERLTMMCRGNPMVVREIAAYLMTHRKLSVQYLADELTRPSERMADLLGSETPFQRAVRLSHEMLTSLTHKALREIASRPGTRVTGTTLAKLTGGQAHLVIEDLIAASLVNVLITATDEPSYLVNEALLEYVRDQQAAPQ